MREHDLFQANEFENTINGEMLSQPLGEKIRLLINKISNAYPIKDEIIETYKNMSLKGREDLTYTIDCIIDNCKRNITQMEKIKDKVNFDTSIKRVK